jgi:hypothetical protein
VVVVIVVVLAEVATFSTSCPDPVPITKYVPTGMFAIPPDATVNDVVPTVTDADVDAVAAAVPAAQFAHAYRDLVTLFSLIRSFGINGSPVFGVHADKPTYMIWFDWFCKLRHAVTPAVVLATKICRGSGPGFAKGTVALLSGQVRRVR